MTRTGAALAALAAVVGVAIGLGGSTFVYAREGDLVRQGQLALRDGAASRR